MAEKPHERRQAVLTGPYARRREVPGSLSSLNLSFNLSLCLPPCLPLSPSLFLSPFPPVFLSLLPTVFFPLPLSLPPSLSLSISQHSTLPPLLSPLSPPLSHLLSPPPSMKVVNSNLSFSSDKSRVQVWLPEIVNTNIYTKKRYLLFI